MHMPHAHNAFAVQEKQKQDAAAANGKAPRQSAGELRVQKGAHQLMQLAPSTTRTSQPADGHPDAGADSMGVLVDNLS